MGRVVGIDFGMKRIGLARSDPMKMIAFPLKTISAGKNLEETADLVLKELEDVETIVLGLPILLSGKDSDTTTMVRKFAETLEKKSGLPLILWDERLTSKQVEKLMTEGQVSRKNRSSHVDTMSATLILQNYLDGNSHAR
ncbi:MAG: Holliday junction resolvase RuvX [Candidatus Neptunochlamydia sp.]|nr:Holliday junction resolvase RuvX [Candidatus Neptunochlamydia sp.]